MVKEEQHEGHDVYKRDPTLATPFSERLQAAMPSGRVTAADDFSDDVPDSPSFHERDAQQPMKKRRHR